MTLREQIRRLAIKHVNEAFTEAFATPVLVRELAQMAFAHQWPESWETRAIRRAWMLLNDGSCAYLRDDEPAEPEV